MLEKSIPKKYSELTKAQQLQDDCDVQATNIILHGLPPDVYALVNHQEAAKDIWDRVKMLMKGTELSYQERECRLYNLFDKFAHVPGETMYEYYWRFSQLINDMHTIRMTIQQLYAYLSQHERHANEVRISRTRYPDSLDFIANSPTLYNPSQSPQHSAKFPQLDSGLAVLMFQQGEDLIECINKAMEFLSAVASRGIATTSKGNVLVGPPRVVKCYNCQGEGHMARQCTQPKRPRNAAWFKEKLMLAEAQEAGQILDEEQLTILSDPGILEALVSQQTIP
ncbi:reverse transcriptase domain-containing protein [Tanacetum coccineum]